MDGVWISWRSPCVRDWCEWRNLGGVQRPVFDTCGDLCRIVFSCWKFEKSYHGCGRVQWLVRKRRIIKDFHLRSRDYRLLVEKPFTTDQSIAFPTVQKSKEDLNWKSRHSRSILIIAANLMSRRARFLSLPVSVGITIHATGSDCWVDLVRSW